METLLTSISDYLTGQSGQIALWAVVIGFGCLLLRKVSAHWRYWLWVLVIAKCLLPPVLTIPVALLPPEVEPVVDFLYTAPSNDIVPETYSGSSGTDYNAMIPEYIPPVSATPMEETEIYTPTFGEKYNRLTLKQKLAVVWVLGAFIYLVIAGVKAIRLSY